jgi:hypothetical protein
MASMAQYYSPGALVWARGRDWMVNPSHEERVVRLRPVDGVDDDAIGMVLLLEPKPIQPSQYPKPAPTFAGDR